MTEYAHPNDWQRRYREAREELAEAWDKGAAFASPHGGAYLRSILISNPYRTKQGD